MEDNEQTVLACTRILYNYKHIIKYTLYLPLRKNKFKNTANNIFASSSN